MKRLVVIPLALLLAMGCAKAKDDTSSQASPDADASAVASDASAASAGSSDAAAMPAPSDSAPSADGAASTPAASTAAAAGNTTTVGADVQVDLPIYPGAQEMKDQSLSMSSGTGSVKFAQYTTKDDAKTVIDWYKSHLPSSWQNFIVANGPKTVGTFSSNGGSSDSSQSVIVGAETDGSTRIQITSKTGK